jgi:hypothetical protein
LITSTKGCSAEALLPIRALRLHFFPQCALDVSHGLLGGRIGETSRQLLGRDVLYPLVHPPQVPLGVANTGNTLAEGKHCRVRHHTRTGSGGLLNGLRNVTDVDSEVSWGRRPAWLGIEQHYDAVAELDLDMVDVPGSTEHPGARSLNCSERGSQETHLCIGVAADHPSIDACVSRRNLNLLLK